MSKPWKTEPDIVDFEAEGLRCHMRRNSSFGCWCGYVGIGPKHPWFGLPRNALIKPTPDMLERRSLSDMGPMDLFLTAQSGRDPTKEIEIAIALRVHGGITYSEDHAPFREPDDLWWFGFDCGHAGDLSPLIDEQLKAKGIFLGGVYRDQQYVVSECQQLAAQLAKIAEQCSLSLTGETKWK